MINKIEKPRFDQPSTWAGIASFISMFHYLNPDQTNAVVQTGTTVANAVLQHGTGGTLGLALWAITSALPIFMNDHKSVKPTP